MVYWKRFHKETVLLLLFSAFPSCTPFSLPAASTSRLPTKTSISPPRRISTLWSVERNNIVAKRPVTAKVHLVANVVSWTSIAYTALSRHPTPAIDAAASLRHNLFTIAQALAFPLPVLVAVHATIWNRNSRGSYDCTVKRLSLGLAVCSLWTAAAVVFGPTFSVGYDLFSQNPWILYGCSSIQVLTACWAFSVWKQQTQADASDRQTGSLGSVLRGSIGSLFRLFSPISDDRALFSFSSLGLLILAFMPQLVAFPTATIPTLLGKRLSRAASGFTFLGAIAVYCIAAQPEDELDAENNNKVLLRGLGFGALMHVGLVVAKLVGLDGGGLLLPGRGLWRDYPSLVKASGAATVLMMATYSVLAFACFGGSDDGEDMIHDPIDGER